MDHNYKNSPWAMPKGHTQSLQLILLNKFCDMELGDFVLASASVL